MSKIVNQLNYPVCLFTVVYSGCEPRLNRFMESVNEQDMDQFELLVLNDGLAGFEKFTQKTDKPIHEIPVNGSIAKVRERGIKLLLESNYEKIVFADADDYFSSNRMKAASNALENCDIYVNDLTTVDESESEITSNYISKRVGDHFEIEMDFIIHKNIMGLGNSAVKRSALKRIKIPATTIAADWMIFTDLLLQGCSAHFNNDCTTFYMQHDQNIAGLKKLTSERVQLAMKVQLQNAKYFAKKSTSHKKWLAKLEHLKAGLFEDNQKLKQSVTELEKKFPNYPLWWEEIKLLNELYSK